MKRAFHVVDQDEQGVTILVVACSLAFVMIALAALVIDVSALFTARGDAKQAADAAALAGAKVLANSGMTSDPTNATLQANAVALATQVAAAVATKNTVGGRPLTTGEVTVLFNSAALTFATNPQITVTVRRTDLPTFFARAWGTRIVPVGATAVAEAVNPSAAGATPALPIAPRCVKPWVLPNKAPLAGTPPIFDAAGTPVAGLVGKPVTLIRGCTAGVCTAPTVTMIPVAPQPPAPPQMTYYFGSLTQPSAASLPNCTLSTCDYEQNIAACTPQPIACGAANNAQVVAANSCGVNRDRQTYRGTRCLINATGAGSGQGQDCISANGDASNCSASAATLDTQLFAGSENPLVQNGLANLGDPLSSSDSLVTVPVYDSTIAIGWNGTTPVNVNVIGFIHGFITGVESNAGPPYLRGQIHMTIVNVSGCGTTPPTGTSGTASLRCLCV